jgi:hypothetical protein
MANNNMNNFTAAAVNFDKLDREIEAAYTKACLDKHEQIERARLNKDEFKNDATMAQKRANEFSSSIEDLAKLKVKVLKGKVENLKNQVSPQPQPEIKVETITKEDLENAKNGGLGSGIWIGAITTGAIAAYALYKSKQRHNREVEKLYNRINELEKNQK